MEKKSQQTLQLKKNEIKQLIEQRLTQLSKMNPQQWRSVVEQLKKEIDQKINEAAGQQTVTVSSASKKDQLKGGIGDDVPYEKLNKKQLEMGTKVEMEHTDSKEIAKEIAGDHLAEQLNEGKEEEDQDYYTKLEKMDPHEDKADDKVPAFWRRNLDYGCNNDKKDS